MQSACCYCASPVSNLPCVDCLLLTSIHASLRSVRAIAADSLQRTSKMKSAAPSRGPRPGGSSWRASSPASCTRRRAASQQSPWAGASRPVPRLPTASLPRCGSSRVRLHASASLRRGAWSPQNHATCRHFLFLDILRHPQKHQNTSPAT